MKRGGRRREMIEILFSQLTERGYKGRIVSIERIYDLEEEIEDYRSKGFFDEELYKERLGFLTFSPPDSLPKAKSIVTIAVPRPQVRVIFNWKGERLPLIIPPTYVAYRDIYRQIENLLRGILGGEEYGVAKASLPEKLLAARSGLGFYGKNNICYVNGMGSFHQLASFFTELPCKEYNWQELQPMKRCENCSACLRSCPTGAITSERFLLRAERCIVFHNERMGDFPSWIDANWHNCVIGCLDCQRVCPENKDLLDWVEGKEEFSQEETAFLLQGRSLDRLPSSLVMKLECLSLVGWFDVLPRNLNALLASKAALSYPPV